MKNKKRIPWWGKLLIIVGSIQILSLLFSFGLLIYSLIASSNTSDFNILDDGTIEVANGKMKVLSGTTSYYDEENQVYYVIGLVENNEYNNANDINICFDLYDEEGNLLGQAVDYASNLNKGERWKFKASYNNIDADKVARFKLKHFDLY